jgi:hypothetical protein
MAIMLPCTVVCMVAWKLEDPLFILLARQFSVKMPCAPFGVRLCRTQLAEDTLATVLMGSNHSGSNAVWAWAVTHYGVVFSR